MRDLTPPALYFENAAGKLLEDPASFLRVNWRSTPRTLEDTRTLFMHISQALRQRGWSRILINQAQMLPFSGEEQGWIAKEWLPKVIVEGGYRHGAIVVSADVMVRLATAFITTHVQGRTLVYHSFETEAAALKWLLQQPAFPKP